MENNKIDKKAEMEYMSLCNEARSTYQLNTDGFGKEEFVWVPQCKNEINLWTYWQGRGVRHPKVLLVGQDWGCPKDYPVILSNVEAMNKGFDCKYTDNHAELFQTDNNLVELFKSIGYDDIRNKNYSDLFFTNLVLGFRTKGSSQGCVASWIKKDLGFFSRLVQILKPTVILCLGKSTFEGVLAAFSINSPVNGLSYNSYIEKRIVSEITLNGNEVVRVFPLAHCGALGTMNRNAQCGKSSKDLKKQKEDWEYINKYI